ncbi:unnamed protein product [Soboliphyme baturini]|uniref:Ion_trans_2 domain-containing protein n=1 Tax=Soboliphyme baturini TaxID=241478 RepID=A0A183IKF9_9BILA|nr:unnamed protein product [Soboliphyme baturini]
MVSFDDCKHKTWNVMMLVDKCLRNSPPLMTVYSTSEFGNALIYAISIYTTIGYGTISVNSVSGQMVSILYAIVGIPLFFALISDLGQVFQRFFIKAFRAVRRLLRTTVLFRRLRPSPVANKKNKERNSSREMALIFACAVGLQILYFVGVSIVFARMERWEFSKSFYFLFQSIALIGLGDVFPHKPVCLLINVAFIMLGIVLLSMCFFILQQKIRKKTSDWSRRMHHSMHTWRYLQNSCQASPRDKLSSFGGSLCLAHRHSLPPHGFCCRKHRRMRKTFRWSLCCRSPSSEEASSVPSQPQLQASCIVRKFPFYGVLPFAPTSPPSCQSKRPSVVVKKTSYMPIPHSVIGLVSLTTYC